MPTTADNQSKHFTEVSIETLAAHPTLAHGLDLYGLTTDNLNTYGLRRRQRDAGNH